MLFSVNPCNVTATLAMPELKAQTQEVSATKKAFVPLTK
jgi:hypothetical protein